MNLSEAEKKKVEEEEAYRTEVRNRLSFEGQAKKKSFSFFRVALLIFILFPILAFSLLNTADKIGKSPSSGADQQSTEQEGEIKTQDENSNFQDLSRKRFDGILANAPELTEIECLNGDCTSVVYFHFKTLPDDLEFMIRANTVTFSNFKYQHTRTSHVSIFATYNNRVVLQCNGAKGVVSDCK